MALAALIVAIVGAGVGGWAAWSARRSANEARTTRLDTMAPEVFVEDPVPLRERWNVSPLGDSGRWPPGIASPGTSFESPGNDGVRLLIGALVTVRNEGSTSVRVSIDGAHRIDDRLTVDFEDMATSSGSQGPPDTQLSPPITIGPASSRTLVLRTGPTLREWIDNGDRPYTVRIRAQASSNSPADEWDLTLEAPLLNRNVSSSSRFDVLAHTLIDARLTQLPRSYPPGGRRAQRPQRTA